MKTLDIILPVHQEVVWLSDVLDLYVVGGIVRDRVFEHFHGVPFEPKDTDLATPMHPDEVLGRLRNVQGIKLLEIGKSFGVVAVLFHATGNQYEIATFRQEWYDPEKGDGRRPDEVRFSTPEADAQRRDLTINALFYNLRERAVHDYVGGIEDIEKKLIRPVGKPLDRYREDRLRVLRTVRFFCRYHDGDIQKNLDWETLNAIDMYRDMPGVSGERIVQEVLAGLAKSSNVDHYLKSCYDLGLTDRMFPYLPVREDVLGRIETRNPKVVLASLFSARPDSLRKRLNAAKWDNDTVNRASFLMLLGDTRDGYELLKARERFLQDDESGERRRILREEALQYARIHDLDLAFIDRFMEWNPSVSAADFPDLKGSELGSAIKDAIRKDFEINVA